MSKSGAENVGLLLTLDRGIRVLEEIARSDGFATAKGLGSTLEINIGTVYQLLRTLQSHGYIHRLPGGRYQLGARIGYLIDRYQIQAAPPQAIVDHLHELHLMTDETVYASLAQGSGIAIVASREGTRRLRVGNSVVGYSAYPHARASSKAFLAYCDPKDLDDFFNDRELVRLTENTITEWDEFLVELAEIRRVGVAFDREEFDEGIACIGTVILDADGQPVGAYAASLPVARFVSDQAPVVAALLKAGENASRPLGYDGEYPTYSEA